MPPSPNQGSEPIRPLAAEDYILLIHDHDPGAVGIPMGIFTNPAIPPELKRELIAGHYSRLLEEHALGGITGVNEPLPYGYWDMFCNASLAYKERTVERAKRYGRQLLEGLVHSGNSGAVYAKHHRID